MQRIEDKPTIESKQTRSEDESGNKYRITRDVKYVNRKIKIVSG